MKDPSWVEAMNETWDLLPPSHHQKKFGCGWIFRVQHNGYAQMHGVDYTKTFAMVAKMTTIQTVIALAIAKGWHLHQMDVKNAFLQGELDEEVYMAQPPGFTLSSHPQVICRLKKSLCGLKQAPKA